jgi:lipoprotein-releasing system permease protein
MASVLGLVIGVMALVISMALMTGYRRDLQTKLLGGNAEVFVYSIGATDRRSGSPAARSSRTTPGVADASPVLFRSGVVTTETNTTGSEVMIKGIEPTRGRTSPMLAKHHRAARLVRQRRKASAAWPSASTWREARREEGRSAISVTVAADTPEGFSAAHGVVRGNECVRHRLLRVRRALALHRPRRGAGVSGRRLGGESHRGEARAGRRPRPRRREIERRTDRRYSVSDWREMNRQLFSMLKIQQLVLFVVIGLIVFVSTFNIVSTLIMTVHEKRREIGILTSMGAEPKMVRRVFIWYGTIVGLVGTATGISSARSSAG